MLNVNLTDSEKLSSLNGSDEETFAYFIANATWDEIDLVIYDTPICQRVGCMHGVRYSTLYKYACFLSKVNKDEKEETDSDLKCSNDRSKG